MVFRSVKILDRHQAVVYDTLVYKLPLRNEAVLRKYTQVYDESAVCQRRMDIIKGLLYAILDDYFSKFEEGHPIQISQIPAEILDLLDVKSE